MDEMKCMMQKQGAMNIMTPMNHSGAILRGANHCSGGGGREEGGDVVECEERLSQSLQKGCAGS